MTANLYVTGIHAVPTVRPSPDDRWCAERPAGVVHAVARPVVDGLTSSACGVLVTATPDSDWHALTGALRCGECSRVAG